MNWAAAAAAEPYRAGFLGQPASAVSSLAFVAAGAGILLTRARTGTPLRLSDQRTIFGLLVVGIGVGSFVQHGPHPAGQAYAHDLPLAATLAFVAADAMSDLSGHELSERWWLVPSVAMVPVVAAGPSASTATQAAFASAAIGLSLLRVRKRPALRATVIAALATAAAGAVLGRLLDRTALHQSAGLIQGHALWHVLAAAALWQLVPAVGARSVTPADEEVPANPHPQQ
jgi:hypothetical protein